MRLSILLLCACASFVTSCSSSPEVAVRPRATATPVKEQQSAQRQIRQVQDVAREADEKAADARSKLEQSQKDLDAVQGRVIGLGDMVAKLQEFGSATSENLSDLMREVDAQESHITGLIKNLAEVSRDLVEEKKLRDEARDKLASALVANAKKDQEASDLRQQLSDAEAVADGYWEAAQGNQKAAADAVKASEGHKAAKKLAWNILTVAGFALLVSIGLNYLQFKRIL